jgi:two-component system sensor histidine kinase UhpB
MAARPGLLHQLKSRVASLSIFARIAIGNSAIIIVGAIGGTLIVRQFTAQGAELFSIMVFALAGMALSILLNLWIVRAALHPMLELRRFVDGIETGQAGGSEPALRNPDPDTVQLASSLSSLINQLEASNRQLRLLSGRAIHAQEDERRSIARNLHDETGQMLVTLLISLERLEDRIPEADLQTRTKISTARQLATDCLEGLRKIIYGLRPAILDDLGLGPAIRWYARENLEKAGIQVNIQIGDKLPDLAPEMRTTLFRIAQEAINNISRHSQAQAAKIALRWTKNEIYLCIEDDGRGFQVAEDQEEAIKRQQWGLVGIQERVELVGGALNVVSDPGRGTLLEVYLPLPASKENPA